MGPEEQCEVSIAWSNRTPEGNIQEDAMGADLVLKSIMQPFFDSNINDRPVKPWDLEHAEALHHRFDAMNAAGGFFRNGYDAGDVMFAIGMSWQDVGRMLDDESCLPIPRARELLAIIKSRPLTRQGVGRHVLENMMDGCDGHPITTRSKDIIEEDRPVAVRVAGPLNIDELHHFLSRKHGELIAILEKSIAIDEPLFCCV
jgi:hypothetical protein